MHQYLLFKRLKGEKSGITQVKQTPKLEQNSQNSGQSKQSSIDERLKLGPVILSTRSKFEWSADKSEQSFQSFSTIQHNKSISTSNNVPITPRKELNKSLLSSTAASEGRQVLTKTVAIEPIVKRQESSNW